MERGFERRGPGSPGPHPAEIMRGTVAERGTRKGFTLGLLPGSESVVSLKLPGAYVSSGLFPGESGSFVLWNESVGGGREAGASVSRNLPESSEEELGRTDCGFGLRGVLGTPFDSPSKLASHPSVNVTLVFLLQWLHFLPFDTQHASHWLQRFRTLMF